MATSASRDYGFALTTRRSSQRHHRDELPGRDRDPAAEEGDEPEEGEGDTGLRRRVRPRGVSYYTEDAEATLKEVRADASEDRPGHTRRRLAASRGHTPKSSVQHNLAKLGMINSPDRKGLMSTFGGVHGAARRWENLGP